MPSGGRGGLLDGGLLDGRMASPPASTAEAEAEKIVRLLNERATAARAETVWAVGTVELAGATGANDNGTNPANGTDPAKDTPTTEATPATQATPATGTSSPAGAAATDAAAGMLGPTGWLEPLKTTWSRNALAAILIPALILLIVCLV
jgi:hypothetical protein